MRYALAAILLTVMIQKGLGFAEERDIIVRRDREKGVATVLVPARHREVRWSDLLRGMARAKGLDDEALAGFLPNGSLNLNSQGCTWLLTGLNLVLGSHMRFETVTDSAGREVQALRVTLDRRALLASRRWLKFRLAELLEGTRIAGYLIDERELSIELDPDWQLAPADRNLVLLVHGLHAFPTLRFGDLPRELRRHGYAVGLVHYPNDQALETSAAPFAGELRTLAEAQPSRKITLVTSSMGGLLARAVVENPELDPGNVKQLLMVAPPTHGSRLAELAFCSEVFEHWLPDDDRGMARRFYDSIEDGLGGAYEDLTPESDFLRTLNARERNPRVSYSIFLGRGGFLSAENLAAAQRQVARAGSMCRFVRLLGPRVDTILGDLEEVQTGKGDGAVSIARGCLAGVSDTIILPFSHIMMIRDDRSPGGRRLRQELLSRLATPAPLPLGAAAQ